jgi:GMP synthase (glutamine-hydrolysing)
MSTPRMLVLQARVSGDPMAEHERRCFVERSGLPDDRVVPHDLCAGPPTLAGLREFDALTVGGSGDFYVSREDLPRFDATLEFLRVVVDRGFPTFASCFGFQCLVRALGGSLVYDPARAEVGTFLVTRTPEAADDELFSHLPPSFQAQMGHNDRVESFPDGAVHLASSARCRYQALRIPERPIWATQFHPELDRETNVDRFRRYLAAYGPHDRASMEAAIAGFRDSPETSGLLRRFLDLVFG